MTGSILQITANEFDEIFGENGFVFPDGCLDRLKKRKNISCGRIVGEVVSVCASDMEKWDAQMCADAIQDYEEKDIFNGKEAGDRFWCGRESNASRNRDRRVIATAGRTAILVSPRYPTVEDETQNIPCLQSVMFVANQMKVLTCFCLFGRGKVSCLALASDIVI